MSLWQQLRLHRKDNRLIVGTAVLLLIFITLIYFLILKGRDLSPTVVTNQVLLFALRNVNLVLVLAILFILLRNLFKLFIERQNRILGSKFKTKLVATYFGLSLVPVLLLFFIASELLQGSIDQVFNAPLERVLSQANSVAQGLTSYVQQSTLRSASQVAKEIESVDLQNPAQRPRLGRRLQASLQDQDLAFLAVYEDTEFIHAVVDSQTGITTFPEPERSFLLEAVREGAAFKVKTSARIPGRLILAAAAGSQETGEARTVVVAGTHLAPELSEQSQALLAAYQSYRQLEVQKPELKAIYLLLFLMVTLVILLSSSWMGLHLARRVTVPIQALADGTRRIGMGDLEHRVEEAADDELGQLVDSFNRMTEELKSSKELLERSNEELLETNRRLGEERALIAAVLENVAAGVISVDREGRIFTCNGAALGMLRQREQEVIGRPAREVWQDSERAKLLAFLEEGEPEKRSRSKELRMVLGGEWKTFQAKATTVPDDDGQASVRVVVLEELTELFKAQKLAAWSEAAKRVAHEIKNPLTPIRLSAERLLRKYQLNDNSLGDALEESVAIIVREVATMQTMVDEFSRFARMAPPQPAAIDLAQLIEETIHLYRGIKPGVDVQCDVDEQLHQAWLDGEQMKSALINLLDNAIEATEPPGRVQVSAGPHNGYVQILVSDTGAGIPPEAKEKLFLPHFSTKGRGTGLGLAIVHRIVSDHHGRIWVADNHPHGTVFTIELPLP